MSETRKWAGIDVGSTSVGEGALYVENVSFDIDGEVRLRSGMRNAFGRDKDGYTGYGDSTALAGYNTELGEYLITASDGYDFGTPSTAGKLRYFPHTGVVTSGYGELSTIASPIDYRGVFSAMNGATYYTNGINPVQVAREDFSFGNAGCYRPPYTEYTVISGGGSIVTFTRGAGVGVTTGGSGATEAGTYIFRYRWYNPITGAYTNWRLCPPVWSGITETGNDFVDISTAAAAAGYRFVSVVSALTEANIEPYTVFDGELAAPASASNVLWAPPTAYQTAGYTQVIVQATEPNGSVFYDVAYVDLLDVTLPYTLYIDKSSVEIAAGLQTGADNLDSYMPPSVTAMASANGRMFGVGRRSITGTATIDASTDSQVVFATTDSLTLSDLAGFKIEITGAGKFSIRWYDVTSGIVYLDRQVGIAASTVAATVFHPNEDTLYWSLPGRPEQWDLANGRRMFLNSSDVPTAIVPHYRELFIFGQRSCRKLSYGNDPSIATLSDVPTNVGAFSQHAVCNAEGINYGWGKQGIWVLLSGMPEKISMPIDTLIGQIVDLNKSSQISAVHDPRENVVMFWFVEVGETEPKKAMCYHIQNGQWSVRSAAQPIHSAATTSDSDGDIVATVMSSDWAYDLESDKKDGCDAGVNGLYESGYTTYRDQSVIVSNVAIDNDNDYQGAYLTWTTGVNAGLSLLISATVASTDAIYLDGAITAPTLNDQFAIGAMHFEYSSKWGYSEFMRDKIRTRWVELSAIPTTGTMQSRLYGDFSATAHQYTALTTDEWEAGVSVTSGDGYATLTMSDNNAVGMWRIPASSEWKRVWRWAIESDDPELTLQLLNVTIGAGRHDIGDRK